MTSARQRRPEYMDTIGFTVWEGYRRPIMPCSCVWGVRDTMTQGRYSFKGLSLSIVAHALTLQVVSDSLCVVALCFADVNDV